MQTKPLAVHCPEWLCDPVGASGPKNQQHPVTIPTNPGDAVGAAFKAILDALIGSPKENLDGAIVAVTATPVADLTRDGFITLWRDVYALAVMISLIAMLLAYTLMGIRRRQDNAFVGRPIIGVLKVLLMGTILPGIVATGVYLDQVGAEHLQAWGKHIHWTKAKSGSVSFDNQFGQALASVATYMSRVLLNLLAVPIQLSVYLTVLLGILSYAVTVGSSKAGRSIQTIWAILITGTFLQLPLVFTMEVGRVITNVAAAGKEDAQRYYALAVMIIAILVPVLLFRWLNGVVGVRLDNSSLRVHGEMNTHTNDTPRNLENGHRKSLDRRVAHMAARGVAGVGKAATGLALLTTGALLDRKVRESTTNMHNRGETTRAQVVSHGFTKVFNRHTPGGVPRRYGSPTPPIGQPAPPTVPRPQTRTVPVASAKPSSKWWLIRKPRTRTVPVPRPKRR